MWSNLDNLSLNFGNTRQIKMNFLSFGLKSRQISLQKVHVRTRAYVYIQLIWVRKKKWICVFISRTGSETLASSQNASEFKYFLRVLRRNLLTWVWFLSPFRIGATRWGAQKLSPSFSWKLIPSFFPPSPSSWSVWYVVIGMIGESLGPGITIWRGEKFPRLEKYFSSYFTFLPKT